MVSRYGRSFLGVTLTGINADMIDSFGLRTVYPLPHTARTMFSEARTAFSTARTAFLRYGQLFYATDNANISRTIVLHLTSRTILLNSGQYF